MCVLCALPYVVIAANAQRSAGAYSCLTNPVKYQIKSTEKIIFSINGNQKCTTAGQLKNKRFWKMYHQRLSHGRQRMLYICYISIHRLRAITIKYDFIFNATLR